MLVIIRILTLDVLQIFRAEGHTEYSNILCIMEEFTVETGIILGRNSRQTNPSRICRRRWLFSEYAFMEQMRSHVVARVPQTSRDEGAGYS